MELDTLSPRHIHPHPPPNNEETKQQNSTIAPASPLTIAEPPSPDRNRNPSPNPGPISPTGAASKTLLSRIRVWWTTHVRLLLVIESATVTRTVSPPLVFEGQERHEERSTEEEEVERDLICDPRDFLALERTFLAYIRTSAALVLFGVVVTQLFVLKRFDPAAGVALAGASEAGGIIIVLIGCARYFRQQTLLARGKTVVAGWHLMAVLSVLSAVLLAVFIVILVEP